MLPKKYRIQDRARIKEVMQRGSRITTPSYILMYETQKENLGVAVVVSSKVSPRAVDRNVVRRRTYTALTHIISSLPLSAHIVVIAKPQARNKKLEEIKKEFSPIINSLSHGA